MKLVLASRSFIRQQLLKDAGLPFDVDAPELDEATLGAQERDPTARALLLAREKARAVSARHPGRVVLGADQVGVLPDGTFLEKPTDEADQVRLLLRMAGATHVFVPAFSVVRDGEVLAEGTDRVGVTFRAFGEATARAYAACGEGRGSCGGYESENRGGQLIERIEGSHHAVLGLPLLMVLRELRRVAPALPGLL